MDITINPQAVEVIDRYTENNKPKTAGLERICINKMRDVAERMVIRNSTKSIIRIKGQPWINDIRNPKHDTYFQDSSWYRYTWQWNRRSWGYRYWLLNKCERYFEDNSEKIISNFLNDTYGDIETAVLKTDSFMELAEELQRWFDERRTKFMEQTDTDIQKWKEAFSTTKPQSHGGVANLLKVLTKTMEKQGADIANIAKVQYAICVQVGIYIPDEFVRDVAVTLDMKEIDESEASK